MKIYGLVTKYRNSLSLGIAVAVSDWVLLALLSRYPIAMVYTPLWFLSLASFAACTVLLIFIIRQIRIYRQQIIFSNEYLQDKVVSNMFVLSKYATTCLLIIFPISFQQAAPYYPSEWIFGVFLTIVVLMFIIFSGVMYSMVKLPIADSEEIQQLKNIPKNTLDWILPYFCAMVFMLLVAIQVPLHSDRAWTMCSDTEAAMLTSLGLVCLVFQAIFLKRIMTKSWQVKAVS